MPRRRVRRHRHDPQQDVSRGGPRLRGAATARAGRPAGRRGPSRPRRARHPPGARDHRRSAASQRRHHHPRRSPVHRASHDRGDESARHELRLRRALRDRRRHGPRRAPRRRRRRRGRDHQRRCRATTRAAANARRRGRWRHRHRVRIHVRGPRRPGHADRAARAAAGVHGPRDRRQAHPSDANPPGHVPSGRGGGVDRRRRRAARSRRADASVGQSGW